MVEHEPHKPVDKHLHEDIASFLARIVAGGSRLSPQARELLKRLDPKREKKR
jgi:hypothetical protein